MLHYNPVETNHIRGGDVFLSAINFFSHEAKLRLFLWIRTCTNFYQNFSSSQIIIFLHLWCQLNILVKFR